MNRPYFNHDIVALEEEFSHHAEDRKILLAIDHELRFRHTARANALRRAVRGVPFQILHFSDLHGNQRGLHASFETANNNGDCDAVALTGDLVSSINQQFQGGDSYPQPWKLIVPGNHDGPDAFAGLVGWTYECPWAVVARGHLLIGLLSSNDGSIEVASAVASAKEALNADPDEDALSVTILMHHPPIAVGASLWNLLRELGHSPDRPVVILHGHDHGNGFVNQIYRKRIGLHSGFVSHVYSARPQYHGLGHHLTILDREVVCGKVRRAERETLAWPPLELEPHNIDQNAMWPE